MEIPKKKKAKYPSRLTVCIMDEAKELYDIGDRNGHDTAELVRQAVQDALIKAGPLLKSPA